jgi:dephospho-CoA kinase
MVTPNPKIWFLTGVSGSGKTTLIQALAKECKEEDVVFLHFDAVGVPSPSARVREYGSDKMWLKTTIDAWINTIKDQYKSHRMVVLEGSMNLTVLQEAIQNHQLTNYEILLIHCDQDIRHHRLIKLRNQPELVNAEMDNWAKCLLKETKDMKINIFDTTNQNLKTLSTLLKKKLGLA